MNRPPPSYLEVYDGNDGTAATGHNAWPQSEGSPARLSCTRPGPGLGLVMQSITVGPGDLVGRCASYPQGVTPADFSLTFTARTSIELQLLAIDPSSTCWPITIYWGPPGQGAL